MQKREKVNKVRNGDNFSMKNRSVEQWATYSLAKSLCLMNLIKVGV